MRTWLAKFRISTALDSNAPRRAKLPRDRVDGDDVRRYEASLHSVDRRLKAAPPAKPVPAALHGSVMRAVRGAAESPPRRSAPWSLRWRPAPALAMLVVIGLGLWWSSGPSPHESASLTAAAAALEQSQQMAQKAPEVVLAPLTQELNNLNRDFQSAVEFLAASVP